MRPRSLRLLASCVLAALPLLGCSTSESVNPSSTSNPTTSVNGPLGDRADLPVDERVVIDNLSGPVDVVRDKDGRPHIYATNSKDALRVEGWLVARDRPLQLEFFRRIAEGRLAEILAQADQSTIDLDIAYRHIGLGRVAKVQYDALPPGELHDLLDAYADGISQVFRELRAGTAHLPPGLFGIPNSAFTDWSGVDSFAIGRLETYLLSYDADVDINTQMFFDAARTKFGPNDPDPLIQKRTGLERDLFRFAPLDPTTTTTGYPGAKTKSLTLPPPAGPRAGLAPPAAPGPKRHVGPQESGLALATITRGYLAAMKHSRSLLNPEGFGSNNWAVGPSRSASGHAMVASDPHLTLSAPAVFWPVSIDVTAASGGDASLNLKLGGISFPGIPGIILGHNEHIAWGATVAGYDVSDAYAETVSADGKSVLWKGQEVALQTVDEVIAIQGQPSYTYQVQIVPHHGPIQPNINGAHVVVPADAKTGAISIRWTGLEATHELEAVLALSRAKNVDEARVALNQFGVGGQNWMLGDTNGDILWTSHVNVPIRDPKAFAWNALTYQGNLPCLVLPGDGSAEWKGYLPDDLVPWAKNPSAGYISTANNDPIGDSLDNDPSNDKLPDGTPMYSACQYDIGLREGRIHTRIEAAKAPLSTADLSSIQGDVRSSMGAALAPLLIAALDRAEKERTAPGAHPDLALVVADPAYKATTIAAVRVLLDGWRTESDYLAAAGIDLDTNKPLAEAGATAAEVRASQATLIFNAWLVRVFARTFDDELDKIGVGLPHEQRAKAFLRMVTVDPSTLATFDPATKDSSLWDDLGTPAVVESRDDRLVRALLDALTTLEKLAGPDLSTYRWGAYHTVTFDALISLFGALAIPPSGDATFPSGFPRHGDNFSIDACDYGFPALTGAPDFSYVHGPTQRFVIEMDPAGPKAFNAMPGGAVWDARSPHFRDEAELWRKNQTHPVPFALADVIAAKETRTVAAPAAK